MLRTQVGHVCLMTGSIAVNTTHLSGKKNNAEKVSATLNTSKYSLLKGDILKADGNPFSSKQNAKALVKELSANYKTVAFKVVDVSMLKNVKCFVARPTTSLRYSK